MVRDPSDGSVKESETITGGFRGNMATGDPKPPVPHESGLRDPSGRADYQKRLEASREWLKEYKSRKASQGHT